jgi:hypothetical protein
MLAVEYLSTMPELACIIASMHCTNAPSVQPVLMIFTEATISDSKNYFASLKYKCTDAFFLTVGSTGASVFLYLIIIVADICTDAYCQLNRCY